MNFKRIIFVLLYKDGNFFLSRNFRLQKVGDVRWIQNNYSFGKTCEFVDEIIILHVKDNPTFKDKLKFIKNVNEFRKKIFVPITLGGGIRNFKDAKVYFDNGADKISINSLAFKDKKQIIKISKVYGAQSIVLMLDYKLYNNEKYFSFFDYGKKKSLLLKDYLQMIKDLDFGELVLNSIDRDGTGFGFDLKIINKIPKNFKKPILLMGGAGTFKHFSSALKEQMVSGAITGNLFNFLGDGLEHARNYSINNKIKLIKFKNIENYEY